ncbi:MAG: hypothetical protein OXQ84_21755 [bacterium]|nr:hypothetical protein [bacterium]
MSSNTGFSPKAWGMILNRELRRPADAKPLDRWRGVDPRPAFSSDIRLAHRVKVGSGPLAAIGHDLDLTEALIATLEDARELAQAASDPGTVDILSRSLETERNARGWLSGQRERLSKGEAPPEASGRFDTMLQRWAVA